eukprot:gene21540-145_t
MVWGKLKGHFGYVYGSKGECGLGSSTTASQVVQKFGEHLDEKTVVVTGATSGYGLETVRQIGRYAKNVIMLGRTQESLIEAIQALQEELGDDLKATLDPYFCDFTSNTELRTCAQMIRNKYKQIHVLINNAGFSSTQPESACPKTGLELHYLINTLATYHFTEQLLPILRATGTAAKHSRIIFVGSEGHKYAKASLDAMPNDTQQSWAGQKHADSKFHLLAYAVAIHHEMTKRGNFVSVFSCHPGWCQSTKQFRDKSRLASFMLWFLRMYSKSIPQASATQTMLACAPDEYLTQGGYYKDCKLDTIDKRLDPEQLGDEAFDELVNDTFQRLEEHVNLHIKNSTCPRCCQCWYSGSYLRTPMQHGSVIYISSSQSNIHQCRSPWSGANVNQPQSIQNARFTPPASMLMHTNSGDTSGDFRDSRAGSRTTNATRAGSRTTNATDASPWRRKCACSRMHREELSSPEEGQSFRSRSFHRSCRVLHAHTSTAFPHSRESHGTHQHVPPPRSSHAGSPLKHSCKSSPGSMHSDNATPYPRSPDTPETSSARAKKPSPKRKRSATPTRKK